MGKKSAFINDVLENEIDGPYDDSALAALCSGKKWTPGLIFKCETPRGGIGNVRNVMMTCTRYAIEAGGIHLPTPSTQIPTDNIFFFSGRIHRTRNHGPRTNSHRVTH